MMHLANEFISTWRMKFAQVSEAKSPFSCRLKREAAISTPSTKGGIQHLHSCFGILINAEEQLAASSSTASKIHILTICDFAWTGATTGANNAAGSSAANEGEEDGNHSSTTG